MHDFFQSLFISSFVVAFLLLTCLVCFLSNDVFVGDVGNLRRQSLIQIVLDHRIITVARIDLVYAKFVKRLLIELLCRLVALLTLKFQIGLLFLGGICCHSQFGLAILLEWIREGRMIFGGLLGWEILWFSLVLQLVFGCEIWQLVCLIWIWLLLLQLFLFQFSLHVHHKRLFSFLKMNIVKAIRGSFLHSHSPLLKVIHGSFSLCKLAQHASVCGSRVSISRPILFTLRLFLKRRFSKSLFEHALLYRPETHIKRKKSRFCRNENFAFFWGQILLWPLSRIHFFYLLDDVFLADFWSSGSTRKRICFQSILCILHTFILGFFAK